MNKILTLDSTLVKFAEGMRLYAKATGKTMSAVVRKKGAQFGFEVRQRLTKIAPPKGSIRADRVAALKAGEGLIIRASVLARVAQNNHFAQDVGSKKLGYIRGKLGRFYTKQRGLTAFQLAAQAEINARESGRGFLSRVAAFKSRTEFKTDEVVESRTGKELSTVTLSDDNSGGRVVMRFGGYGVLSDEALDGLYKTKGMTAVVSALDAVTVDMIDFSRKLLDEQRDSVFK